MKRSDLEPTTDLDEFQKLIGYRFKAVDLLATVFSHSSFVNENKLQRKESNERLEFLGDAVAGVVTNRFLFEKYPEEDEGFLTRVKSLAVSQPSLAEAATKVTVARPNTPRAVGSDMTILVAMTGACCCIKTPSRCV